MLQEHGIEHSYREYRKQPLSEEELVALLAKLQLPASSLLRKHDKHAKELALTGAEPDEVLVPLMAAHPTLLQRPIGVKGDKAVVGRPVERLLGL